MGLLDKIKEAAKKVADAAKAVADKAKAAAKAAAEALAKKSKEAADKAKAAAKKIADAVKKAAEAKKAAETLAKKKAIDAAKKLADAAAKKIADAAEKVKAALAKKKAEADAKQKQAEDKAKAAEEESKRINEAETIEEVKKTWLGKFLDFLRGVDKRAEKSLEKQSRETFNFVFGKDFDEADFKTWQTKFLDWFLPMNVMSKLMYGVNLEGEPEKLGNFIDIVDTIALVLMVLPFTKVAKVGTKVAEKAGVKGLSQLAGRLGEKKVAPEVIEELISKGAIDVVYAEARKFPGRLAPAIAKLASPIRDIILKGLSKTADKTAYNLVSKLLREAAEKEGLNAIQKVLGVLPGKTTGKKLFVIFSSLVGMTAGYITLSQFLAWTGKEAIKESISFSGLYLAIDNKNWELAKENLPMLKDAIEAYEKATSLTKVIPFIKNIWKEAIENSWIEYRNYEKLIEEGLAGLPGATGTLIIDVEPSDAEITVGAEFPATGHFEKEMPIGIYDVVISRFGYKPENYSVEVLEGETSQTKTILEEEEEKVIEEIPPEEIVGKLTISVGPAEIIDDLLKVEVAGQEQIISPGTYELSPGSYDVQISREGFITQRKIAYVSEKKDTIVSFILEEVEAPEELPIKSTIQILSDPSEADIYIDGKYQFTKTPFTIVLDPGTYIIRVQKENYYPQEASVSVAEGDEIEIPFYLEELPEEEAPAVEYFPTEYYYPDYTSDVYYTPEVIQTPYSQVSSYDYSLLDPDSIPYSEYETPEIPEEKELLINIETTDLKPWNGRIYSIAMQDLSRPELAPLVLVNSDEKVLISEFLRLFEEADPKRLLGFKLTFDYRFIFAKMMLYRLSSNKFRWVELRDVKQIMDQVKEEFVYFPDKTGTLDNWGKMLFGIGKYSSQEDVLRKFTQGDFDFVSAFQLRQLEITNGLYQLSQYCGSTPFSASESSNPEQTSEPIAPESETTPISTQEKKCPECLQFNPINATECIVCGRKF